MTMTLRLTASEQEALRARADAEGISMQEAARRAVREFLDLGDVYDLVIDVAAGQPAVDAIAERLRQLAT